MAAKNDLLMLIDGHSLAFRAYYALPDSLKTPEGDPVQAVYGFINMLFKLLEDERPRWVGFTFDEGRPFRHELYAHYKAGREDIPEDIRAQVRRLRWLLGQLGAWQVAGAPFEADDYLATLSARALAENPPLEVLVVTGDRDLFQIVGPGVTVLYPQRGIRQAERYDAEAVERRFGVTPEQLTDFKALVGDPSDNIPGVRGVGEKTAARLLNAHRDLAGIYEGIEGLSPALRRSLEQGRDDLRLSRELVKLRTDAPAVLDLEAMTFGYDHATAVDAMQLLGFDTTIGRLPMAYRRGEG